MGIEQTDTTHLDSDLLNPFSANIKRHYAGKNSMQFLLNMQIFRTTITAV